MIDPLLGSAIIGGASGLISDIGQWTTSQTNFELQKRQQDYMKEMQQRAWEREDSAVRRRVADLRAAGLSPTLAAGSSAQSSGPIGINIPQREAPKFSTAQAAFQSAQAYQSVINAMAQNHVLEQQADNLKSTQIGIKTDNAQKLMNAKAFKETYGEYVKTINKEYKQRQAESDTYLSLSPKARAALSVILPSARTLAPLINLIPK